MNRNRITVDTVQQSVRTHSSLHRDNREEVISLNTRVEVTIIRVEVELNCGSVAPAPTTTNNPAISARCAASHETLSHQLTPDQLSQPSTRPAARCQHLRWRVWPAPSVL